MKKIFTLMIFSMLALPAFAEDAGETKLTADASAVIEDAYEADSDSNAKFPNGLQFGLGVSVTSGVNGFVGYANKDLDSFWLKRLGLRFDFATTSPIESTINSAIDSAMGDGVDIGDGITINDGAVSAQHFGALVDFYPFGNSWFLGGWRLTGGYMVGKMNMTANLTSSIDGVPADPTEFELNGELYRYPGSTVDGSGTLDWNYSGPYLGTGFDLGLIWGVKIYMDAGVVFTNKAAVFALDVPIAGLEYSADGGTTWAPASVDTAGFEADKEAAVKEANEDLEGIEIFPMVKLGFMYRF